MKTTLLRRIAPALLLATLCVATACSDKDEGAPQPGPDEAVDRWMADYLTTHYLWNEAMQRITPDYGLGYEAFLDRVLRDIAAQGDVNHDDGHWENGVRKYFYSNVERRPVSEAKLTRNTHRTAVGTGVTYLFYGSVNNDGKAPYYLQVRTVSPHAPAGRAGLRRGDYILEIDGSPITDWSAAADRLRDSKTTLTVSVAETLRGETRDLRFAAASYDDNPVWASKVLTAFDGTRVGYLCYDAFNYYYDDKLLAAFASLRDQQPEELILDLRYNGGGHVVSSAVLATLVAGDALRGEVFATTFYNAARMAAGERTDRYCIGEADYGNGSYEPIAGALASALGLRRVYVLCTASTASASELFINGLRGLGVEVRLIGGTTNGKNVGMEPRTRSFDGYEYEFNPITFYSVNAQGFRDYGDGFAPQVAIDEKRVLVYDWGDERDMFLAAALTWIGQGTKPGDQLRAGTRTRAAGDSHPVPAAARPLDGMIRLPAYDL